MRIHIIVPEELLEKIDRLIPKGKRSEFIRQAIEEKLAREAQSRALKKSAGILDMTRHQEWDTPEKISAWARASRENDIETLKKLGYLNVP